MKTIKYLALPCKSRRMSHSIPSVLCGRATWKEGIPGYASQGVSALEDWLSGRGVENIQSLNEILTGANSWKDFYGEQIESV